MQKEIILLASSKKYHNYCIAGIDKATGQWIRVVSDDPEISEAVNEEDMRYEDGSLPNLLDIIRIQFLSHYPNYFQPENYLFDKAYYWQKIGKALPTEIASKYASREDYIFYNNGKRVDCDYIQQLEEGEKYSLIGVIPDSLTLHITQWPEGKKITMSFYYKRVHYQYLPVTDISFLKKVQEHRVGNFPVNKEVLLVISLGENYHNAHYKLIAGIIGL